MSVIQMHRKPKTKARPPVQRKAKRVYAICFYLDTAAAEAMCGAGWRSCYEKIKTVFSEYGFDRVQGSVYFGDESSDAVRCVMAVQEADRRFAWFGRVVKDLRMLRVDEDNDLLPALSTRLRLDESVA